MNANMKNNIVIKVKGKEYEKDTYYLLDSAIVNGKKYYLVESESVGEEDTIIIDSDNNFITCAYNGFNDLYDFLAIKNYKTYEDFDDFDDLYNF